MRVHRRVTTFTLAFATTAVLGCDDQTNPMDPAGDGPGAVMAQAPPEGKGPKEETAGNNLSYPVIWAEGVTKTLPGAAGMAPVLNGEWWYQWGTNGTDPDITPASCEPDPDEGNMELNPDALPLCDDGNAGVVDLVNRVAGVPAADNPLPLAKAFIQKDMNNTWQAESADWSAAPVNVHWIDWGDNLESVDWYTRSQVRTEVVLFQDLENPMLEYEMRHTDGWGINEVHGLAAMPSGEGWGGPVSALFGEGTRATVYSHCARLMIQLLLVDREDPLLADLVWEPEVGWTEPEFASGTEEPYPYDLINPHIFNGSVHEGGDGPGFYSAEINVKGRIIYGYTWNVRNLHDDALNQAGAGDYRITFSLDETCGTASLNTYFTDGVTQILVPLEEEMEAIAAEEGEEPGGGAVAVLDLPNNLTYIDVSILEKGGGKK